MTTLFEDNVYMVVENLHQSDAAIELTGGEWDGLVYQYAKVGFENGKPNINFERTIRRLPHNVEKTVQKFQQLAKDAQTAGDPVLVENYLQHADHYLRRFNELIMILYL